MAIWRWLGISLQGIGSPHHDDLLLLKFPCRIVPLPLKRRKSTYNSFKVTITRKTPSILIFHSSFSEAARNNLLYVRVTDRQLFSVTARWSNLTLNSFVRNTSEQYERLQDNIAARAVRVKNILSPNSWFVSCICPNWHHYLSEYSLLPVSCCFCFW